MLNPRLQWNPVADVSLLTDLGGRFDMWSRLWTASTTSPIEISSDESGWRLRAGLAGLDPRNIEVQVIGDRIIVRASEQRNGTAISQFEEVVTLPSSADVARVSARYRHGLLELRVPYKQQASRQRIEVRTSEMSWWRRVWTRLTGK